MNVEFYCGNNLIGMWGVIDDDIKDFLYKFGDNEKNIISNPDIFFSSALEYREILKTVYEKELYKQILIFTQSCSTIKGNNEYLDKLIESTIFKLGASDSLFDKVDSLSCLYDFYSKINDNNTFWFRYVED